MYEYRAHVIKVYDGDTVTVDIDLGFGVWLRKQSIRLAYLNTPEVRGEERVEGLRVRDIVREKIMGQEIILRSKKKGKYGRWIGEIILLDESILNNETNLNVWLLNEGLAKPYTG